MRVGVAATGILALLAAPRAWALCPSCLGQSSTLGPALRLVGLFLLIPPAIFFAVTIAIRRFTRERGQGGEAPSPAPASGSGGGDQGA